MFTYIDNFLPEQLFQELNERMLWRYKPGLRQDQGKALILDTSSSAIRIRTSSDNNDYTESAILLGKMVPAAVELVKNYLTEELKFINPEARSIWFQYHLLEHRVGKHYDDGNIRKRLPHQCFSTFLYSHEKWEDDWGGELCFNDGELLPKSNRLITYSRDEEHWVNLINHDLKDYKRMFLGMSWSTDNDF